jgi:hypothetical protein
VRRGRASTGLTVTLALTSVNGVSWGNYWAEGLHPEPVMVVAVATLLARPVASGACCSIR